MPSGVASASALAVFTVFFLPRPSGRSRVQAASLQLLRPLLVQSYTWVCILHVPRTHATASDDSSFGPGALIAAATSVEGVAAA